MADKPVTSKYEMDTTSGSILPKMIRFAIPVLLSGILQLLFNAADLVVVGRFVGHEAVAAVGANTSLIFLLTNLFIGLSVGATAVAARYYSMKLSDDLSDTVHTSIALSFICGLIITVVGLLFARQVLVLMNTPEDILDGAQSYFTIIMYGMVGMMLYNFGSSILRSIGDSRRPLYFLVISGVVNVGLNLLLVLVFGLGVKGVAIATVVSQYLSAMMVVICLIREKNALHLDIRKIKLHKKKVIAIFQIGLPAGFQAALFSISNVIIQSSINSFDSSIIVAGNSISMNVEFFVFNAMESFYAATLTFASQNFAIGNLKRIDKSVIYGSICAAAVGILVSAIVLLNGRPLLGLFNTDPDVIEAGMKRLWIICTTYFTCGIMDVIVGGLRGIGRSFGSMLISLAGVCGLRLIWIATVFQMPQYHSIEVIYYSYPLSWVVTLLLQLMYYLITRKKSVSKDALASSLASSTD